MKQCNGFIIDKETQLLLDKKENLLLELEKVTNELSSLGFPSITLSGVYLAVNVCEHKYDHLSINFSTGEVVCHNCHKKLE